MRSTLTLKALGLCVLLLSVMAISAGGAQAAPEWMENGANIVGATQSSTVKIELDPNVNMLTKINTFPIEFTCTAATMSGFKLTAGGNTTNGTVKFTGCKVFRVEGGVPKELACNLHSAGEPAGTVKTKNLHADLVLHEKGEVKKRPVSLVKPEIGTEMARLLTEKCVLPEAIPVVGGLEAQDCENHYELEQVVHLFIEEPDLTELFVINTTEAEHKAKLDGGAKISLESGLKWSGLAG